MQSCSSHIPLLGDHHHSSYDDNHSSHPSLLQDANVHILDPPHIPHEERPKGISVSKMSLCVTQHETMDMAVMQHEAVEKAATW